ncbi:hypothetical protein EOD42_07520 [Rhodovarius crocodyli]|uniref:Uncharacterized protein n=1 Tax=Rhodovarius crocodyli TaxID=1979269 RepID=A0A437MJ13_9PROT|nr:hypothetical protein [Rhodovarius crocodyli]RVT97657.1 hypothetical protein EOD42_07520 [Rhodovarius crocodyli]
MPSPDITPKQLREAQARAAQAAEAAVRASVAGRESYGLSLERGLMAAIPELRFIINDAREIGLVAGRIVNKAMSAAYRAEGII